MNMKYIRDYIQQVLADGKYFFSKEEVLSSLSLNSEQFRFQAYRLLNKKVIRHLTRDFFMIIPPEYQHLGGVPPHWIIDPLMEHLGREYYIALLSAASMYGATNQQPMTFQIITNKTRRSIELERGLIKFYVFNDCSLARKEQLTVPTGYVQISCKEQTVLDLVRFYKECGYLSNVSAVIKDLAEMCDESIFENVIHLEKNNSVLQRLGFICEQVGYENLATLVEQEILTRSVQFIRLSPDSPLKEGNRNIRFKLIINDSLEIEE
ncbi:TPA: type IV toxin-antitoxin system AbiEi family antitoxin domain-containing protein [Legionella pneumophila]|uniref:type IV toxin-antitoxin system AbiEi family antitoxin domain-containing protein n=1 Tax=Legionella TaxID=445 RepID=UPI000959CA7F|nr:MULTISPECIES: type IV toxin-antitoxin system AbiEi family antitoxin [Legionella]MBN9226136.1 hypothetical protein [Legionella steelei]OJW16676.1 MAG: hypothetical protein BGO44_01215 [Legionella sp. 39-23]HAU0990325.1 hypothetical protein [Legionella pneumophila]